MLGKAVKLSDLSRDEVPADLRIETYFDLDTYPFEHRALLDEAPNAYAAITGIHDYAVKWLTDKAARMKESCPVLRNETPAPAYTRGSFEVILEEGALFEPARVLGRETDGAPHCVCLAKGARLIGADVYLDDGSIYLGEGTTVEPCAGIKGPMIIGQEGEIRQGAYLRGDTIIGNGAVIRGEIKNCVLMDKANFPHPSYLGDSLCGYMTHFGNQATTANVGLLAGLMEPSKRPPLVVRCDGKGYDLGKPKMGICMGDFSQAGCNTVTDPGTFLKPYTLVYPLSRVSQGFYGPNEVLKNLPLERGVIRRAPFRAARRR